MAGPVGLLVILAGFPLVLLIAVSTVEPPRSVASAFSLAGGMSYPLYAIHGPLVVGLMYASRFWNWDLPSVRLQVGYALPLALAVLALWLSRSYDQPVRRWLARRAPPIVQAFVPVSS